MTLSIFILFSLIIGAMVGSFITALVWRTRHGRSMLETHSVCPNCQHPLGPKDLVPIVSYLLQGGRCRYCRKPISSQYPLIELTTAMLFAASAWHFFEVSGIRYQASSLLDTWILGSIIFVWVMLSLLIALFIYDLRWGELPNRWTLGGSSLALVATMLAVISGQPLLWQPTDNTSIISNATFYDLLITVSSGVLAAGFFLIVIVVSEKILKKPGMGMGDAKLALLMGLFLGFPGIIVALYLAFILGAVLSLVLIATKRKQVGMAIPFGPFMVAGTILAWRFTPTALGWFQQFVT